MKIKVLFILCFTLVFSVSFAHPGRLDSSNGHKDTKNVSGLGSYHFHCNESDAHLHPNGVCPYAKVITTPTPPVTPQIAEITVSVNSEAVTMADMKPFIENGRTYVPVRAVLEAYGVDSIEWVSPNVTIKKGDITLVIPVGQNMILKNGSEIAIDAAAQIKNGRTCLPIRAIIEALGGSVGWDASTKTVIITSSVPADSTTTIPLTSTPLPSELLFVHFIDVGQGDSIFIDLGSVDILIDAGDKSSGNTVVSYLQSQKVDDIELLVATHNHEDHIGGMPEVFDAFIVEAFMHCDTPATSIIYKTVMAKAETEKCTISTDKFTLMSFAENKDLRLQFYDNKSKSTNMNNQSILSMLQYGSTKFVFTGDAESETEALLADQLESANVSSVDVFKSGHHGSNTANSDRLLKTLSPVYSVISYGIGNSYGHPHIEAMDSLKRYSDNVVWTAGKSVIFSSDGLTVDLQ